HPYTRLLIDASPDLDTRDRSLHPIAGEIPSPSAIPSGCRFHTRCPRVKPLCIEKEPDVTRTPSGASFRCHFPLEQGDLAGGVQASDNHTVTAFRRRAI
ncbi:hypothetical protein HI113_45260, partial [Corallococcus exiguus]|uniref:oligopeptide/dipeptide ABC transporter ATP-binding protein n=1 Tax=Corallococcus exiguus TaxID=83462 RepID=UPI0017A21FA0|nr:hypothetical protein [Corallococcus exiguus]